MGRRSRAGGPSGLLLVDKPQGITSAAVVARVRRVLGGVKAGHTGTLDPFATGLLPVCLGEGTKLAGYLTGADKAYEGIIRLGMETDTLDRTGVVTATCPVPPLDPQVIEEAAAELRASTVQVPPSYSAIKREGRPMYELAQRGEAPELEARPVRIGHLELSIESPERLRVSIACSKGFYVRSLARDLGVRLGCGAVLEELRRTRVGHLGVEDALPLAALEADGGAAVATAALRSLDEALGGLRRVDIAAADAANLRAGRQACLLRIPAGQDGERIRVSSPEGLVAVAACDGRTWSLERVFAATPSDSCPAPRFVLAPAVSQMEEEERNEANHRD